MPLMIRQPAVSGRFYPGNPTELIEAIQTYTSPPANRIEVIGAVIPHAGYMYSGHVAGAVYARLQLPPRAIVMCPNHTGLGPPLSIMRAGSWLTPLGELAIDEEMSEALMHEDPDLIDDAAAHRREHATEVQVPFIQHIVGPNARFVPITVGTSHWSHLDALGQAIAHT